MVEKNTVDRSVAGSASHGGTDEGWGDRREAAATLLEGLASGKLEVTGTSRKGSFHFAFDDKAE